MENLPELINGEIYDPMTGLRYRLNPGEGDQALGVIPYQAEVHGHLWRYLRLGNVVYAINPGDIDWDSEIQDWDPRVMGRWPFGSWPTEEERIVEEAMYHLDLLIHHLDDEIEEMDRIEDMMNAEPEEFESDDEDPTTEDEGYNTSPEVDFGLYDYWALGLCHWLLKVDLYLEREDGYWTL